MSATILFANNAQTTIAGAITNVATSVNLASGAGSLFPSPGSGQHFVLTFVDAATGLLNEIVWCTSRSGDTLTIIRGQEGTAALAWNAGDIAANFWTAGQAATLLSSSNIPTQAVSGASATFANSQLGTQVVRSNSGGAMQDTLPGTGGSGVLTAGDPITITNGDATAVESIKSGAGASISGGAFIYLGPSQTTEVLSDGSNYWPLAQPRRIKVIGTLNLYVAASGNDGNDGLTSGTAWLTLQNAWNFIARNVNVNGNAVQVNVAAGTYAGFTASGPVEGAGTSAAIIFSGDTTTPSNVIISAAAGSISVTGGARLSLQGFEITSSAGVGIGVTGGGSEVVLSGKMQFNSCSTGHIFVNTGGMISLNANYTIAAAAPYHIGAFSGGRALYSQSAPPTVTISGTPAFSTAFANASDLSLIVAQGVTFSGSATGSRYLVSTNAVIDTNGGGATYLPGNAGGTAPNNGLYV